MSRIVSTILALLLVALFHPVSADSPTTPPVTPSPVGESTETSYNPAGTASRSSLALISARRADPEFPGFLLGMQAAAIHRTGSPLNVAPLSAGSLEEQAEVIRRRGVDTVLVDAPDGTEGRPLVEQLRREGLRAALITSAIPRGERIPMVLDSPLYLATRMAETAIHTVGGEDEGPVWYIEPKEEERDEETHGRIRRAFLQSFDAMAPHIIVQAFDPSATPPDETSPEVICILPPADGLDVIDRLRRRYPDARLIIAGQSDALRRAHEEGHFDVRVRPDYIGILGQSMRELVAPSQIPPFIPAAADFR